MSEETEGDDLSLNTPEETEAVSPELELSRKVATRAGWAPKEEWKHDPAKWEDADKYLERIPQQITNLKDRAKQTAAAAQRAMDLHQANARAVALEEVRQAAAIGNPDAAVNAAQRAVQPPTAPEVVDWIQEHPWFNSDAAARDRAIKVSNYHESLGKSTTDCLKAVDEEMSRLAPHYYPAALAPVVQHVENQAPAVQPGNRNPRPAQKRSWDTLPSDVRANLNPIAARLAATIKGSELKTHREAMAEVYYRDHE